MSAQALINFIAGLRNTAKDGLNVSVVGSLAKLSTEPFPDVVEGYSLIEFYPNPDDNKYYRGYLGEWREI